MVRFTGGLLLFSAIASAIPTDRIQSPLTNYAKKPHTPARKLNGKFLHITGIPRSTICPGSSPCANTIRQTSIQIHSTNPTPAQTQTMPVTVDMGLRAYSAPRQPAATRPSL